MRKSLKRHEKPSGEVFENDETSMGSGNASVSPSRFSFVNAYALKIAAEIKMRDDFEVKEMEDGVSQDLTPQLLSDDLFRTKIHELSRKIAKNETSMKMHDGRKEISFKAGINIRTSLDDIATGIAQENILRYEKDGYDEDSDMEMVDQPLPRVLPFIKVVLRRCKVILLFEQRSSTVLRGTDEGNVVENDNKYYDYITFGKGRIRRTTTSEAQTIDVLYKSRDVNTKSIEKAAAISYVSNFEMFDTYRNLELTTKSVKVGDAQHMNITTYKVGGVDQFESISETNNFKLALMVTLRMLAGNTFEEVQRRFRNMILPNPLARDVMFTYGFKELFTFELRTADRRRKSAVDIAFCPGNGDIVAIAYGIYSYGTMSIPKFGYCCVWNIKNPVNPERVFSYPMPVVSIEFSSTLPQLLAIGLFDGSVEVRDIGNFDDPPIATSQRTDDSTCDPITSIKWLETPENTDKDTVDIDPFLALSQDGSVTKYRVINSPNLLAFPQMQLDRVEGSPEGILITRPWRRALSSRCPQGRNMVLHPRLLDLYYLLTDEGCIHKCSTNYPHQHLEVLQVHNGGVSIMDFSPWSPKVFLTAGGDWHIRIWMEGILKPLITLKNENSPILWAAWSKTHSTVIVSLTRKAISVWDIRRSVLSPVYYNKTDSSVYTLFKFSRCGRSIAIGKERGTVTIFGLEDFPFPPHFQYDELELAIYRANSMRPDMINELKSIGFFGYPEHRRSNRHRCY